MKNKSNIWIINHYALPPYLPGGTRHFDLSKKLVESGYKVTIFASSFHYQNLKDFKEYKENEYYLREERDAVNFVWFKTVKYSKNNYKRILNMLSFNKQFKRYVREFGLSDAPEIIIGSSVHLFAVNAAYKASLRLNSTFLMEVRDIWPQTLIDLGVSKLHPLVLWMRAIEKKMYQKAKRIIVLLPKAKEHILEFGVPESKIKYLPNGVDMSRYPSEQTEPVSQNEVFTVVYAGVIGLANNLEVAIEAARIFKEKNESVKFKIVGEGQERERLTKLAESYGLNNIEFTGSVPKSEINKVLAGADALFFNLLDSPVFKYGLSSNKLFDYLASRKPIIFSCKAGNNPVEEAGAGISIEPNSPELLYEAINELKSLPKDTIKQMGENGYNYVKKIHSMEVLDETFRKIIEEVHS